MAYKTGIEWTDSTFNPWVGCQHVSAGCDLCYAEALNARRGWTEWGPRGLRRRTTGATWANPRRWNAQADAFEQEHGRRRRVFCASLADVFDNRAPKGAREDLWALIRETPRLEWQLLTKRPENITRMLPPDWGAAYPSVWLGTTVENGDAVHRIETLRRVPARVRFLSVEPLIGPTGQVDLTGIAWVITGGESGPKARVCDPAWTRAVRDACLAQGVAYFHKQHGVYASNPLCFEQGVSPAEARRLDGPENGKGGALLDGRLWREFPIPRR